MSHAGIQRYTGGRTAFVNGILLMNEVGIQVARAIVRQSVFYIIPSLPVFDEEVLAFTKTEEILVFRCLFDAGPGKPGEGAI